MRDLELRVARDRVIDWKELRAAAEDRTPEGILEWKEELSFEFYCEQLRVETHASYTRIQHAYRKLALLNHPDLQPSHKRAEAEQRMKQINEAYRVLRHRKQAELYADQIPDPA